MSAIHYLLKTANGLRVLTSWLGSGGTPVPQEQAEARSWTCVAGNDGNPCPSNVSPNWWEKSTGAIAETIRETLRVKHDASLTVRNEAKLFMCQNCGCALPLKVWTPIHHVRTVLSKESISNLPSYCWMKTELLKL
jgi:hypothetical protein